MTLMETIKKFDSTPKGIVPIIHQYSLKDREIQGWLTDLRRIYMDAAQLHWNALYLENAKICNYLRSELRRLCKDLLVCHYLVQTYEHYALSRAFKIKVTILKKYKELIFGYMKALERMI